MIKKNILSNGICIVSLKKRINNIVLLSITDFNNSGKIIFDLSSKKIIGDQLGLSFIDDDLKIIEAYIAP